MNNSYRPFSTPVRLLSTAAVAIALLSGAAQVASAAGPDPVDLGAAAPFVILAKSGISTVPISDVTGNMGVSPIDSTAITGFSLTAQGTFSKSAQVTGKIYAANYAAPTPANMTTAVSNMEAAYTDAAGRSLPDFTELYAGNLSNRTLVPGLYKWGTGVLINTKVTFAGTASDVWILQISGNLTLGSGTKVLLSGGALAKNIFWQVGGGTGVEIGTTAKVEGTILAQKAIHLRTGASLNGRALAQTAVTLEKNTLVIPRTSAGASKLAIFLSDAVRDGYVRESGENSNQGGTRDSTSTSFRVGDDDANNQFRSILHFDTSSLPDNAAISEVTLLFKRKELTGTDPFGTHGPLQADIRSRFGSSANVEISDFQASASGLAVATFDNPPASNWYSAVLNAQGRSFISKTSSTQFRLRFATDDNDDFSADFLKFYSGDNASALRPQLQVRYTLE